MSQPTRRKRVTRGPYIPGSYDYLLTPREWAAAQDLIAITLESAPECCELVIVEHTRSGQVRAHHIAADHRPIELEFMLSDGSSVYLDITIAGPDPALTECAHTPEDMFLDLREPADLMRFSGLENPELVEDDE